MNTRAERTHVAMWGRDPSSARCSLRVRPGGWDARNTRRLAFVILDRGIATVPAVVSNTKTKTFRLVDQAVSFSSFTAVGLMIVTIAQHRERSRLGAVRPVIGRDVDVIVHPVAVVEPNRLVSTV